MTIDDLTIGQSGVISQVGGEGPLRLRFLDMGLIPGTKVTLQKIDLWATRSRSRCGAMS